MNRRAIDDMSWRMSEVYAACVDKILANIARHFQLIKDGAEIPGSWDYQVKKLAEMGEVTRETERIILDMLGEADDALKGMLEEAILTGLKDAEPTLRKAAEKGLISGGLQDIAPRQMRAFQAYYEQSADKLNLVNTVMLESTEQAYAATVADIATKISTTQGILNTATGQIITGVDSFNKVQREAVRRMAANGLTGFIDHGGHHWSPEAYVAMDMRTTMTNTARAAVWEDADAHGVDLYQVSWHDGARPLCYPWQGKVISRDGWTGEVEDDEGNKVTVHSESEIPSFKYGGGLFGVNCGHYPIPFIPGFSRIREPHQNEEENAKEYAESQQQRALERKVRDEKRELEVMKAQGASKEDIDAQKRRVRNANAELTEFCDKTGRARQGYRTATPINATFPDGYKQTKWEQGIRRRNPSSGNTGNTGKKAFPKATSEIATKTIPERGIKAVDFSRWDHTPTEKEIISAIGGPDRTSGSCASVALTYAGNKAGYQVHDFRGGDSMDFFSRKANTTVIAQLPGVDGVVIQSAQEIKTANKLLEQMEDGKEYFLGVGRHASIVRRAAGGGYEYLELQNVESANGWHTLDDAMLRYRFGCVKRRKYALNARLIDIEKLGASDEFPEILRYINTAVDEQRKGLGGGIR